MPSASEYMNGEVLYILGLFSEPKQGKKFQAMTFPRCYMISCNTDPLVAFKQNKGVQLYDERAANLVWIEQFACNTDTDYREMFLRTKDPKRVSSIFGCLAHAVELVKAGEVKTLIVDGYTYLADYVGGRCLLDFNGDSEANKIRYYGQLKTDLSHLTTTIFNLSTLHKINVILTGHIERSSPPLQIGKDKIPDRRLDPTIDIQPRIEGKFKEALAGIPRGMLYLNSEVKSSPDGKTSALQYRAYCQRYRHPKLGLIPASNNYGLPPVLELTGKSLYEELTRNVRK